MVERLETLGFAEVCGPSMRDCREGHDSLKEGLPGKGRGAGEGVSRCFKACPRQTMNGVGREARGSIGAASTRDWPNWQAGRQASRQAGRLSGMQPVGGSSSGSSPDGSPMSPCLRTSHVDRFPRWHAACHLCRHADMQIVIRAEGQTVPIAGRPQDCSDAAPQHHGCKNP